MVIAITGIHGNFYSNPFYYNFGDTLNAGGIDFIYAQTNDAMGAIRTRIMMPGEVVDYLLRAEGMAAQNDVPVWREQT